VYLDASALVKRYVAKRGSRETRELSKVVSGRLSDVGAAD